MFHDRRHGLYSLIVTGMKIIFKKHKVSRTIFCRLRHEDCDAKSHLFQFVALIFISTFADSLSCMNAIQMRWGSTRYPYSLKTRMLFSCLVYTGRYIRLTRVLIKWRWTLGTMVILYSINLLQPLLEESFLVSIERSVVILFTPVGTFKFQTKRKISQILIGTICPHWETPQYTA